ncbi:MAG: hypothetical protein MPL62_17535, partial [Alphaproteobacteria bacterium]|nr:hypothetical protein [Alphaproteobacteria bacterium]
MHVFILECWAFPSNLIPTFSLFLSEIWCAGRPPVGELKKVGKSRIFWQKVGGFFTKVGKSRIIFSLF